MPTESSPLYVPCLRFKVGEYRALARIAPDVADKIAPRFILPPPREPDTEERRVLGADEFMRITGERIGKHWPIRTAYVEPRFLFNAFDPKECTSWLPRLFESIRRYNARAVPVATLDDLVGDRRVGFQRAIATSGSAKIAMRISYGEIDRDLERRVDTSMENIGVSTHDCVVFLDFAGADFSDVEAVSDIAAAALESLQSVGLWQQVIFQGSNFPEKNPAGPNCSVLVRRNEWRAWRFMVEQEDKILTYLTYGDYCADSANLLFDVSRARPIRHYRYCADEHWFIVRGKQDLAQMDAMRSVSETIVKSGHFGDRDFSSADAYIYDTAKGLNGGGGPSEWREINTARHITKVVSDLGGLYGFDLERHEVEEPAVQHNLL